MQRTYPITRCEQQGVTPFPLSGRSGIVDGLGFHSVSEGNELKAKGHRVRTAKKCQEMVYFVYCKHTLTIAWEPDVGHGPLPAALHVSCKMCPAMHAHVGLLCTWTCFFQLAAKDWQSWYQPISCLWSQLFCFCSADLMLFRKYSQSWTLTWQHFSVTGDGDIQESKTEFYHDCFSCQESCLFRSPDNWCLLTTLMKNFSAFKMLCIMLR